MINRMVILLATVLLQPVQAADNGQWNDLSPAIRQWYRELMQPDNPTVSCCGAADAYWADDFEVVDGKYLAIVTDDREIVGRPHIAPGTRILIPNHKLKYDAGNPTGHGVVFMNTSGTVYCFIVPPGV
jgi:hypothetical protein